MTTGLRSKSPTAVVADRSLPAPVSEPAGAVDDHPNADAPVRVDVTIPRQLYERLTAHDAAPRSRYDMTSGRAEFVAEPGLSHEWRAWRLASLFDRIEDVLDDAGRPPVFLVGGASRLLSDDGAFEPDTCLFVGREKWDAAMRIDGWLDHRRGHPAPDLVVEIDRSVESSHKLAPYFRIGVREAWTWSHRDGVRLWVSDPAAAGGFRATEYSRVLPGLERIELDRFLASRARTDVSRRSRSLARRVVETILAMDESAIES